MNEFRSDEELTLKNDQLFNLFGVVVLITLFDSKLPIFTDVL